MNTNTNTILFNQSFIRVINTPEEPMFYASDVAKRG